MFIIHHVLQLPITTSTTMDIYILCMIIIKSQGQRPSKCVTCLGQISSISSPPIKAVPGNIPPYFSLSLFKLSDEFIVKRMWAVKRCGRS